MDATLTFDELVDAIHRADTAAVRTCFHALDPADTVRIILQLEHEDQAHLLTLLKPEEAADIVRDVGDKQAADVIEDLPPPAAAAIVDTLPSDEQADLLGQMDPDAAHAILGKMRVAEAADASQLMQYPPDTAGGLMIKEYLAYREHQTVEDVVNDLRLNREHYRDYDIQYIYVTDAAGRLDGVMRIRDLLFSPSARRLREAMVRQPVSVQVRDPLVRLGAILEDQRLRGLPVVDEQGVLVGTIRREAVEEAEGKQAGRQLLRISGIMGGEELRAMPLGVRSRRRLAWLSINIFLNVIAASVIAFYQDTVRAAVALAVFLPIISDMSGCSGNQAVAVSIRELALGMIRPWEYLRVLVKESSLGVIVGLALGVILALVAWAWKGNLVLALVVGGALAANTIVSVSLGGLLPLVLRRLRIDPALLSGPILTTVTDTCGFFLVLSMATLLLAHLK